MQDPSAPDTAPRQSHRLGTAVSAALSVLFLAGVVILLLLYGRQLFDLFRRPEELRALVTSWGPWAGLGIVAFQVLQIVIAPLPGHVVSFVVGYAIGLWPGLLWLLLGVMLGSTISFMLARLLGRRLLRYLVPPERLEALDRQLIRRGTFYLFLLILVPNPVGDLAYYLAGLTPLPLPVFLALVFLGRLPSSLIECGLGSGATRFGPVQWGILAAVAAVATLLYFLNQRRIARLLERWSHVGRFARRRKR